jgi:hypothetical protein
VDPGEVLEVKGRLHLEILAAAASGLISEDVENRVYAVFLAIFYGCETWSLALRKVYRPRVFVRSVLMSEGGSGRKMEKIVQ